jgi:hypothetical protein
MHANTKFAGHYDKNPSDPKLPFRIWIGGTAVRTIFLVILTVITARVASPQIEHFSSLYEAPGGLIRVGLGLALCLWTIVHVFILPKDAEAFRTWIRLGLALLPLSSLCAFVAW